MKEDLKELIAEWFADCNNVREVAELFADIKMENQRQMEYMIDFFVKGEE